MSEEKPAHTKIEDEQPSGAELEQPTGPGASRPGTPFRPTHEEVRIHGEPLLDQFPTVKRHLEREQRQRELAELHRFEQAREQAAKEHSPPGQALARARRKKQEEDAAFRKRYAELVRAMWHGRELTDDEASDLADCLERLEISEDDVHEDIQALQNDADLGAEVEKMRADAQNLPSFEELERDKENAYAEAKRLREQADQLEKDADDRIAEQQGFVATLRTVEADWNRLRADNPRPFYEE